MRGEADKLKRKKNDVFWSKVKESVQFCTEGRRKEMKHKKRWKEEKIFKKP